MQQEQAKKTYKDLKEFLSTLSEDQLTQEIIFQVVDDCVHRDIFFGVVEEDIYMRDDDVEDTGSLAQLKEIHGEEFNEDDCEMITPKGSVYLGSEI